MKNNSFQILCISSLKIKCKISSTYSLIAMLLENQIQMQNFIFFIKPLIN